MYTGADLQNVCREAALIALTTIILGAGANATTTAETPQEPVVSQHNSFSFPLGRKCNRNVDTCRTEPVLLVI